MLSEKQLSPKGPKRSKRRSQPKPMSLANRLIAKFQLKKDGDFIRFKDGPSRLTASLAKATRDMELKYQSKNVSSETLHLVHYASFVKNPLRYIFDMIERAETTQHVKESRVEVVHEIVRQAMQDDPLSTVKSIVCSLARVARF